MNFGDRQPAQQVKRSGASRAAAAARLHRANADLGHYSFSA
jgi:hypothetical protein